MLIVGDILYIGFYYIFLVILCFTLFLLYLSIVRLM